MRLIGWILLVFVLVLGATFAILNAEFVTVHYYIGKTTLPLSILVVSSLVLGMIIGWLFSLLSILRLKMECLRLARKR